MSTASLRKRGAERRRLVPIERAVRAAEVALRQFLHARDPRRAPTISTRRTFS